MNRPERRPLKPLAVAEYWLTQGHRFPNNPGYQLGLYEPYCMACGWCPPIDPDDHLDFDGVWTASPLWLNRSHLANRADGGLDDVQNIVLLDVECHRTMGWFGADGAAALRWVNDHPKPFIFDSAFALAASRAEAPPPVVALGAANGATELLTPTSS